MFQRKDSVKVPISRETVDAVLGILLQRAAVKGESLTFTKEELEDAPDVEMRELFETDQVEVRVATKKEVVWG